MKEFTLIRKLVEMYKNGYTDDELSSLIDEELKVSIRDGITVRLIKTGKKVVNEKLQSIALLSNDIYESEEMDKLLLRLVGEFKEMRIKKECNIPVIANSLFDTAMIDACKYENLYPGKCMEILEDVYGKRIKYISRKQLTKMIKRMMLLHSITADYSEEIDLVVDLFYSLERPLII